MQLERCDQFGRGCLRMANLSGTTITIFQGETLPIKITVLDSEKNPATNLQLAKFALKQGDVVTIMDCTIEESVVSIKLSAEQTIDLLGSYTYEFRVKSENEDVDSLIIGSLSVKTAPISTLI